MCFNGAPSSQTGIDGAPSAVRSTTSKLQRGPVFADGDRTETARQGTADTLLQRGPVFADGDRPSTLSSTPVSLLLQRGPVFADGDRRQPVRHPLRRRTGFNGAPSSQTGIERCWRRIQRGDARASTGPRLRRRGSVGTIARSTVSPSWLQRGPVFADGDRWTRRPARRARVRLQRGPVFADGDRIVPVPVPPVHPVLQRGPVFADGDRSFGNTVCDEPNALQRGPVFADGDRGCVVGHSQGRLLASTGPRLRRRGSDTPQRWACRCPRCFNGAPSSQTGIGDASAKLLLRAFALQRGPVFADGDRRRGSRSWSRSTRCFNGAPSSQTGIAVGVSYDYNPSVVELQRGPVFADGDR